MSLLKISIDKESGQAFVEKGKGFQRLEKEGNTKLLLDLLGDIERRVGELCDEVYNTIYSSDEHLGCYSYPFCADSPYGCRLQFGDDAEPIGHRD
jgi:hypothetical protein